MRSFKSSFPGKKPREKKKDASKRCTAKTSPVSLPPPGLAELQQLFRALEQALSAPAEALGRGLASPQPGKATAIPKAGNLLQAAWSQLSPQVHCKPCLHANDGFTALLLLLERRELRLRSRIWCSNLVICRAENLFRLLHLP